MTPNDKEYIRSLVIQIFYWMDASDVEKLYNSLEDELLQDIEETADRQMWNDDDVLIALRRTLLKKLNIE